ncbi:hypothetical protein ABH922_001794 [Rhodococcus sp. 27YEA15]|uniref:hypothetical protein n=1 Tax=Rhodococcus sp. 27YEA15 TaxID=3156259 RepID=UPI003C79A276
MSEKLTARQVVPLTSTELADMRACARQRGMSTGLYARALLLHAFGELEYLGSPGIEQAITAESSAAQQRVRQGAKTAAAARWAQS